MCELAEYHRVFHQRFGTNAGHLRDIKQKPLEKFEKSNKSSDFWTVVPKKIHKTFDF